MEIDLYNVTDYSNQRNRGFGTRKGMKWEWRRSKGKNTLSYPTEIIEELRRTPNHAILKTDAGKARARRKEWSLLNRQA